MSWAGHIACMVEMRVLVGKPERKPPLGRPRPKSEGNIKMEEHGLESSGSEYGQVVGSCECSNESLGSVQCGEFLN